MTTSTLLIECLLHRDGGSLITMKDGATYHFKDDGLGNHVAAVSNPDHIQRFMQIPEAYAMFTGAKVIGTIDLTPVVQVAPVVVAEMPTPEPVALPPQVAAQVAEPELQAAIVATADLASLSDPELRAVFKAEIGRVPSPKTKPETMIAQIEGLRAERAAVQG